MQELRGGSNGCGGGGWRQKEERRVKKHENIPDVSGGQQPSGPLLEVADVHVESRTDHRTLHTHAHITITHHTVVQ